MAIAYATIFKNRIALNPLKFACQLAAIRARVCGLLCLWLVAP
jgi:hypothetical protein